MFCLLKFNKCCSTSCSRSRSCRHFLGDYVLDNVRLASGTRVPLRVRP